MFHVMALKSIRGCWNLVKWTRKRGKKLDVITNFKDYGFNKPLFLIRGDVHKSPLLKVVDDEVESRCR